MPGFEIDRKRSFALSPTLIDIAGGIVEDSQHGQNAVGEASRPADVGACGAHIVDADADASGRLRNLGARLQGIEDAVDARPASAGESRRTSEASEFPR